MSCIIAEHISKDFNKKRALDDVSIQINQSEIFGILGPNGAGKTTFIRILNQIFSPDSGTINFKNTILNSSDIRKFGYLPEERGLYKKMKISEQILYFASLKGMNSQAAKSEMAQWFERLEITDWKHKNAEELSKGMQQKVQFIVAAIHKPEVLILDEPFSGFDPINAELLKQEILRLKSEGTTIILSTHNMNSVEELCDSIALIHSSKKILDGKTQAIRSDFASNKYEIQFKGYFDSILSAFTTSYKIIDKQKIDDITTIQIEMQEDIATNDLIKHLMSSGAIQSFQPIIPSMNEIFIKAVNTSNSENIQ